VACEVRLTRKSGDTLPEARSTRRSATSPPPTQLRESDKVASTAWANASSPSGAGAPFSISTV